MATVEVILKQKIEGLGAEADVVKVKRGFARNFLLPQDRAFEATKANLRHVNRLKEVRAKREADEIVEAENAAGKLKKLRLSIVLSLGQGGKSFGSVTSRDVEASLKALGYEIDRRQIRISETIKAPGVYTVEIKLHSEVIVPVSVKVIAAQPPVTASAGKEEKGRKKSGKKAASTEADESEVETSEAEADEVEVADEEE
jgi:large subunit ribosomal protein L9